MKKILTSLILVASGLAFAQVGINAGTENTDPHQLASDAVLHVENKANEHKGVLLPSVALTSETDQTTTSGGTVTTGLMVWNDGTADLKPAGYYYWNGTKWILTGNVNDSSSSGLTTPLKFTDYKDNVTIKKVTTLALTDWKENDFMKVLMNGFSGAVNLPDPSKNKGRFISVQNISGGLLNYAANHPENVGVIGTQRSHLLISDGSNWFIVGGLGM